MSCERCPVQAYPGVPRPVAFVTAVLFLLLGAVLPHLSTRPVQAASTHSLAARVHHIRVYGYIMDSAPATDVQLKIYSKTHDRNVFVTMTVQTVIKQKTQILHRANLATGMYVIVTCRQAADGTLVALTVHIELHHRRAASTVRHTRRRHK